MSQLHSVRRPMRQHVKFWNCLPFPPRPPPAATPPHAHNPPPATPHPLAWVPPQSSPTHLASIAASFSRNAALGQSATDADTEVIISKPARYQSPLWRCQTHGAGVHGHSSILCLHCAAAGTMRCSRCRVAHYCSESCQRLHWTTEHNITCRAALTTALFTTRSYKPQAVVEHKPLGTPF
jgi:hypothetical protein